MTINETLLTSDFNLASFLYAKKCKLLRLDRANPKRINFIFNAVPQGLIDEFWENTEVKVNDFIQAQRELKQRIFSDVY